MLGQTQTPIDTQQVIDSIREDPEIREIKIIVGGNAFSHSPLAWKRIGADGFVADADGAKRIAHGWWQAFQAEAEQVV